MSENVFVASNKEEFLNGRRQAFKTIFYSGLVVGILDGLFALVYYGLILGAKPMRIFQSIASGLLGKASFEGGTPTVLLGVLLHFVIASCIAAVYYMASLKLPFLIHNAVACGLIYGMIAFFGMNYVVIPLSAAGSAPFSLPVFLTGIIGHAFLVGLPIALLTRRFAKLSS